MRGRITLPEAQKLAKELEVLSGDSEKNGLIVHRRGEILLRFREKHLYKDLGYDDFAAFCRARQRLEVNRADEYILVATTFNKRQLKRCTLGIKALVPIARAPAALRDRLLTLAKDHTAVQISEACQQAGLASTIEEARARIEALLKPPEKLPRARQRLLAALRKIEQCPAGLDLLLDEEDEGRPLSEDHRRRILPALPRIIASASRLQALSDPRSTSRSAPDEDDSPPPDSAAPAGPIRPPDAPGRTILRVPFPYDDPDFPLGPADPAAAALIVLFSHAAQATTALHARLWQQGLSTTPALLLALERALFRARHDAHELIAATEAPAREGQALLQKAHAAGETTPPLLLLPPEQPQLPLAWLSFDDRDPLDEVFAAASAPSAQDRALFSLIALLDLLHRQATDFLRRVLPDPAVLSDTPLVAQLHTTIARFLPTTSQLHARIEPAAEIGRKEEALRNARRAEILARDQAGILVVGADTIPEQHTTLGLTRDGLRVVLAQDRGQIVVLLGRQGYGKSHLGYVIIEGILVPVLGVSRVSRRGRAILMATNWRNGPQNHQMLRGFYPNPRSTHWDYLAHYYGVERCNAAYRRGTLLCLPGEEKALRARYPELIERGLSIHGARMHPQEGAHFAYSLLLRSGRDAQRAHRPRWHTYLEDLIADYGPDVTPELLRKKVENSNLDFRSKGQALQRLAILERFFCTSERILDHLKEEGPLFVLLESAYQSPEFLLPLHVALMNALSQPVAGLEGLMRWFFLDELNKYVVSPVVGQFLLTLASEVRHGLVSVLLAAQRAKQLPRGLLALATVVGTGRMTSKADYQEAQEEVVGLARVPFEPVSELEKGELVLVGAEGNTPRLVETGEAVRVRPTCIWAGGETVGAW